MDYWILEDIELFPYGDLINYANGNGNSMALSAYSQSLFRLNNRLTANIGVHGSYFRLNGNLMVEPRAGIRWQAMPKHAFGLAYGKHSRRENTDYYFVKTPITGDEYVNENLNFAKAHHLVLTYDWKISEHLRLKVEPYYQHLYDIPVEKDGSMSLINHRDFWLMIPLVNDGKGKNYGIDFTLERYLNDGYYYLLTASLFESKYTGGDGVWRDTRLNRNYVINALGGKEWKMGKQKQNMLSVSLRFTYEGGQRYTPVNEAVSLAVKGTVYDETQAYGMQLSPEFISHFTVAYKINRNRVSHELALKMINVTGNEEFEGYWYNHRDHKVEMYMSAVILPNICYKIEF
jgi:hypothetical protein